MPENENDPILFIHPWEQAYIDMQANPMDQTSDKEFAESQGISQSTLSHWKSKHYEEIFEEAFKRRQKFMRAVRIANYKAIMANLKRSFNDRKLMAQIGGDLIERTESKIEYLTPDQKREKINQLLTKLGKS